MQSWGSLRWRTSTSWLNPDPDRSIYGFQKIYSNSSLASTDPQLVKPSKGQVYPGSQVDSPSTSFPSSVTAALCLLAPSATDTFSFFFLAMSCGTWDLVPRPGIEPASPALEMWTLNYWTDREVPWKILFKSQYCSALKTSPLPIKWFMIQPVPS